MRRNPAPPPASTVDRLTPSAMTPTESVAPSNQGDRVADARNSDWRHTAGLIPIGRPALQRPNALAERVPSSPLPFFVLPRGRLLLGGTALAGHRLISRPP